VTRFLHYCHPLSVLSQQFCHASFLINPSSQLVATSHNWPQLAAAHASARPLLPLLPPCASKGLLRLRPLFYSRYPPAFQRNSAPSIFVSGPIIIHCICILYPVFSIRSATYSFVPAFLHPLSSSPSSPWSCRLDFPWYCPRQGLSSRPPVVHPTLAFLRV